jgi:hypothetical protein
MRETSGARTEGHACGGDNRRIREIALEPVVGDRLYLEGECSLCHTKAWASWEEVEIPMRSGKLYSAWVGNEEEKRKREAKSQSRTVNNLRDPPVEVKHEYGMYWASCTVEEVRLEQPGVTEEVARNRLSSLIERHTATRAGITPRRG